MLTLRGRCGLQSTDVRTFSVDRASLANGVGKVLDVITDAFRFPLRTAVLQSNALIARGDPFEQHDAVARSFAPKLDKVPGASVVMRDAAADPEGLNRDNALLLFAPFCDAVPLLLKRLDLRHGLAIQDAARRGRIHHDSKGES